MTETCKHHWMVSDPVHGAQDAYCIKCPATTTFHPVFADTTEATAPAGTPIGQRLNPFVGPHSFGKRSV